MRTVGIETHSHYLNVVLLETSPEKIIPVAVGALDRIERIRKTRIQDVELPWHPHVHRADLSKPEGYRAGYRPRLFVVSGTFDIAAVFLSPTMELSAWMQSEGLLVAGQDINICLLPTAASLQEKDDDPALWSVDFNEEFSVDYEAIQSTRQEFLPAETAFVSVTKIKVSPLVLWPISRGNAPEETGRMKLVLRAIWEQVAKWRQSTRVGPKGVPPKAAIGLSFGWNELTVVAHADSPGKLLRLSLLLRQPMLMIQTEDALLGKVRENQGHLASTTITVIGHDFQVRKRAREELQKEHQPGYRLSGKRLVELALDLGKNDGSFHSAHNGEPRGIFFQIGCHTYPGHERRLLNQLGEVEQALCQQGLLNKTLGTAIIEVGKKDIWTPMVPIGADALSPRAGMALIGLLQEWTRRGALASGNPGNRRIPDAFDFYSRIACLANHPEDFDLDSDWEDRHVRGLPHELLSGQRLLEELRGGELQPASDGETGAPAFVENVRSAMRVLQLPYSLSEQVLHVINVLLWANERELVWDESIELVPPVLALTSFLQARERWWNEEVPRIAGLHRKVLDQFPKIFDAPIAGVREQLERHPDSELVQLGQAFRAYFYNVHFSSYLTGEMPDLNLRYKGSVHQLLRIANMILDALTDIVLGPRACMAIVGDRISPEVSMPCHVTVVQLNSTAFTMPVLLESLAHEVAHQFLRELVQDSQTALRWRDHPWVRTENYPSKRRKTYKAVRKAVHQLNKAVFRQRLADEQDDDVSLFIESASDFLEMQLLDYPFHLWLRSFLLRAVLAARPSSMDVIQSQDRLDPETSKGPIDVPAADHDIIASAVVRAIAVYIAEQLIQETFSESFDLEAFKRRLMTGANTATNDHRQRPGDEKPVLAKLHRLLKENCVLGPKSRIQETILSHRAWNKLVEEQIVNRLPWLADRYAVEAAALTYKALKAHARWLPEEKAQYLGTGRLWPSIQAAFKDLWMGQEGGNGRRDESAGIDRFLLPSLYIRHWMAPKERDELRNVPKGEEHFGGGSSRRFHVDLQPVALGVESREREQEIKEGQHEHSQGPGEPWIHARTQIFQRGGIHPADPEARTVWEDATRRLLVRLLLMVPAWHRAVLAKIDKVLKRTDDPGN